jgi:hypothetical protein
MSVDAAFRQMIRAEIEDQLRPLQNVIAQLEQNTADLDGLRALAGLFGFQVPQARAVAVRKAAPAKRGGRKPASAGANALRCAIVGCKDGARTKGYCSKHYQKLRMLIRTHRRPEAWVDGAAPNTVPDLVLPRGRAASKARKAAPKAAAKSAQS